MKVTKYNGRSGKHGAYNPKHNDREFDVAKSDHIDAERMLDNVYWDYHVVIVIQSRIIKMVSALRRLN